VIYICALVGWNKNNEEMYGTCIKKHMNIVNLKRCVLKFGVWKPKMSEFTMFSINPWLFSLTNQNLYPTKGELCSFWNSSLSKAHFSITKYTTIFFLCFIIRDVVKFHLFRQRINKSNSNRQCILENLQHRLKCMFLEDFSNNNILMNTRYTKSN